ncbi:MAG TPA: transglycosylase domain-containing protein [Mycobacteriales bacterium]|nr:transglycosylase domain-containing protein [Mycobacteriales bacterium]
MGKVAAGRRRSVARGWRRAVPTRRQVLVGLLGAVGLVIALVAVGYATTTIPNPSAVASAQTTYVYASDGHTVLGRLGSVDRVDVPLSRVPAAVRFAVLAAEDRNYYSEPGISIPGIARAMFVDITGGSQQGGSTITQQYAKNAYLTQARTFSRKIREVFLAIKIDRTRSKNTVLEDYLNTIYFGRGAYGIEAAARAYFGVDVGALNVAQGAVLAAVIDAPAIFDPAEDRTAAVNRWHYVIHGMVIKGWLPADKAALLRYPPVLQPHSAAVGQGPGGFIVAAVRAELAAHGISGAQLEAGGYRITTTIDARDQRAAVTAENQLHAAVPGPVSALVAVQPGDGAVRAYYGGANFGDPKIPGAFDDLVQAKTQPGSSFKPYVLMTALAQGVSLDQVFDGTSPKAIPGYPGGLSNAGGEQCPRCSLIDATARSINTVYVPLAIQVGPDKIAATAHAAGIPATDVLADPNGYTSAGIALGVYDVRPLDQAVGYATIAAQGVEASPYLVAKVTTQAGQVVYTAHPKVHQVIDPKVAADATYALEQVLDNPLGTAYGKSLANGRPAAGKTGTSSGNNNANRDAWFVGYTPQLCGAVWLGNLNGSPLPTGGNGEVFGGGPPAAAWQTFMNLALAKAPIVQFPAPSAIGTPTPASASPTPSKTRSPTPTPTASATLPSPPPTPRVTVSVGPSVTPSLNPSSSPTPSSSTPPPTAAPAGGAGSTPAPP